MIKVLKKEMLAWKVIRECSLTQGDSYFLVEASIPKGAIIYINKKDDKFRCSDAIINHITLLYGDNKDYRNCMYGDLPTKLMITNKTQKEVEHCPLSIHAHSIIYAEDEILTPSSFCDKDRQCSAGLHFFKKSSINKVQLKWM